MRKPRKPELAVALVIDVLNLARDGGDLSAIKFLLSGYEDVDRVRECARVDCRRVFFAKNVKGKHCSDQCRNVTANRILRSNQRISESATNV